MKSMAWAAVAIAALVASGESYAQSAQEILEDAWDAQLSRWDGLDSYLVEQTVMGRTSKEYHVRTTVTDTEGNDRTMFLPAADAGLEAGCVDVSSRASADTSESFADSLSWFLDNAELVGEESIDGNAAWQLRAHEIEESRQMNGEEITMDSMTMWLSKDDFLPLKMRIDGVAVIEGRTSDVVIESLHSDFRTVAGTQLVEPYRRVMNISGMMGAIDPAQIAQAQAQMEEMEKQLASMPESQRQMMEQMMGPQLEMIRGLAETGGIETEIVVESITPNPEAHGERVVACEAG